MPQVKIHGLRRAVEPIRQTLSDTIHSCIVEHFKIPATKRFHRFILLEKEDFIYPASRSEYYLIIEILMMEGRSEATKKELIKSLFANIAEQVGIANEDVEVLLLESPASHWGFRGKTGDEINLNYSVEV